MKLRIVTLTRAVGMETKDLWRKENSTNAYLTLGQFDLLRVEDEEVDPGEFFKKTEDKYRSLLLANCDGKMMHHVLFLIPTNAKHGDEDEGLWDGRVWKEDHECAFLGIIRIHLSNILVGTNEKEKYEQRIHEKIKKWDHCAYNTVELSDIVVVIRTKQIQDILEIADKLQGEEYIGKTYTYLSVKMNPFPKPETISNKEIEYVSMRVSLDIPEFAIKFFHTIDGEMGTKGREHTIIGIDDIERIWYNVPEKNLVNAYKKWYEYTEETGVKGLRTIIGKKASLEEWSTKNINKEMQEKCKTIIEIKKQLKPKIENKKWFRPLSTLTFELWHMSRMPELDEFVLLILPSILSFFSILKNSLDNERFFDQIEDKTIKLIDAWNYLHENTMGAEEQFIHSPEVRPSLYRFPAVLLEYLMSFLYQSVELLQSIDDREKRFDISFLLTPQLSCTRVESELIFDALIEGGTGLVWVNIPRSVLENLEKTKCALCHEVSHFVGENCRCREKRREKFLEAVSWTMGKTVFGSANLGLARAVNGSLNAHFAARETNNRLANTKEEVNCWFDEITSNGEKFKSFFSNVLKSIWKNYSPEEEKVPFVDVETIVNRFEILFEPILEDLYQLFREAFADICAVYLLDLSAEKYLEMHENEYAKREYEIDGKIESYSIRLAVCLYVLHETEEDVEKRHSLQKVLMDERYIDVKKFYILCGLQDGADEPREQKLPANAIICLVEYLKECYEELKKIGQISDDNGKKNLDAFREKAKNNVWDNQDGIMHYRRVMLQLPHER